MAKTSADSGGTTLLEDSADFYRPPAERDSAARSSSRPARAKAEPEDDAGEPFLRARRRVPVRRGLFPAWTHTVWGKAALAAALLVFAGAALATVIGVRSFVDHDPRFRIESAASIQTFGNSQLSRNDLLSVFGSDIGRNLFFVPLLKRRAELEQIPWVEKATVMRLLPNQLRVAITERKPVAFVQVKGRIDLADAAGVILTLTPQQMAMRHYSFPVITGINPADPLSVRSARMQIYERFISDLDATGERVSAQFSEVNLSDPDDVRGTVTSNGSELLLHFGEENFQARWRNYQAHVAQWQQQYPHLASIDLRYEREVVLKMAGDPGVNGDMGADSAKQPVEKKPEATARSTAPAGTPAKPHRTAVPQHKIPPQHHVKTHKPQVSKHAAPNKNHGAKDKAHASRRPA